MSVNKRAWEQEYKERNLMSGTTVPRSLAKFFKFVKKEWKCEDRGNFTDKHVLDLGAGEGKNAFYLAERGAHVVGIEIAENAVAWAEEVAARKRAAMEISGAVEFHAGSFGAPLRFADESFDVVLDVTSSNSLTEKERAVYFAEVVRVLKPGGYLFVRVPARDAHAKALIKKSPGKEANTYIIPGWGLCEHVFSAEEFKKFYGSRFKILHTEKETHYTSFADKKYKRDFLIGYFQKK